MDIAALLRQVEAQPEARFTAAELRVLGLTPERVRRWFTEHHGMTFVAWRRARRLATAFTQIRGGAPLDDVALGNGFESHSGFREAFSREFGGPPGRAATEPPPLVTTFIDTPIGRMLAAANDAGVALLEFNDRTMLSDQLRGDAPAVSGRQWCRASTRTLLGQLRAELDRYFAGRLREFTVPLAPRGTPFQEKVWAELRRIPPAVTIAYDELARRIGQPTAQRAVARANGQNCICDPHPVPPRDRQGRHADGLRRRSCGGSGCCWNWNGPAEFPGRAGVRRDSAPVERSTPPMSPMSVHARHHAGLPAFSCIRSSPAGASRSTRSR